MNQQVTQINSNGQQEDCETLQRHRRMMAGWRLLVIAAAGPLCTPQRDGMVAVYSDQDLREERPL